jgi:hypothetical protein
MFQVTSFRFQGAKFPETCNLKPVTAHKKTNYQLKRQRAIRHGEQLLEGV